MKLKETKPLTPLPDDIETYITKVVPTMEGWMSEEKGRALARHVLDTKPEWAVEIGVFAGRSLITIALAMRHNGRGSVNGIDPWSESESVKGFLVGEENHEWWKNIEHSKFLKQTEDSIKAMGVDRQVALIISTSEEALKAAKMVYENGQQIDLLHIDGNHSVTSALFDVENWVPLVQSGGSVWLDDRSWASTKKAQERILDFCDLIEVVSDCGIYGKK